MVSACCCCNWGNENLLSLVATGEDGNEGSDGKCIKGSKNCLLTFLWFNCVFGDCETDCGEDGADDGTEDGDLSGVEGGKQNMTAIPILNLG